jgi:hypothetical protein
VLPSRLHFSLAFLLAASPLSCSDRNARYATGPSCEERQRQLVSVLESLPDQTLNSPVRVPLPTATLAGHFGKGPVFELGEDAVLFDGQRLPGQTQEERIAALARLAARSAPSVPVYVATSPATDVRTLQAYLSALAPAYDLRLVFSRPATPEALAVEPTEDETDTAYADQLLLERDPAVRRRIAAEGYQAYSDCEAVDAAATAHQSAPEGTRWAGLKRAMIAAVPQCKCSDIDPDGLRSLLVAEQRAGNVAVGSMPAGFLRDVRCRASMPLRTVQQVLGDVESFEAEFSGNWDDSGVRFEEVVTNERLLNYLCTAMPGELFESISAEFATVYLKHTKATGCQAYRLEPVARGAVFGTFRAAQTATSNPAPSFHYRLGGNDLRVYGPLSNAESRPTDEGPWSCNKDLKLSSADAHFIEVEGGGRLYFDEQSCEAAPQVPTFDTCAFDPTSTPLPVGVSPSPDAVTPPAP